MTLPTIDSQAAKRLIDEGAVLVDIREADEHRRERVPGARHHALSGLGMIDAGTAKAVVFHCRSGARTQANASRRSRHNAAPRVTKRRVISRGLVIAVPTTTA